MKPTEAVMLARYIRAYFPQQPIDEFTADALAECLADYPAEDCRQAVRQIAERGEKWCAPTDVKAEVKRIRAQRIAAFGPIDPPPDLDVAGYLRWLRDTRKAIADGTLQPPPEIEAPRRDVVAELGHVGRRLE